MGQGYEQFETMRGCINSLEDFVETSAEKQGKVVEMDKRQSLPIFIILSIVTLTSAILFAVVATEAGATIERIVPDIERTATLVQGIAAVVQEIRQGAEQSNSAMQQLDHIVQMNAASSEELSATSEALATQAEQLRGVVSFFRLKESGRVVRSYRTNPVSGTVRTQAMSGTGNPKLEDNRASVLSDAESVSAEESNLSQSESNDTTKVG
jgi:hypothetical protein